MPPKTTVPVGSPGARGVNLSSSPSPSQRGGGGGGPRREYADAAAAAAAHVAATAKAAPSPSQRGSGGGGPRREIADAAAAAAAHVAAAAKAAIVAAEATAAADAANAAVRVPVRPSTVTLPSTARGGGGGGGGEGGGGAASFSAGAAYGDCRPEFHGAFDLLSPKFDPEYLQRIICPLPVQSEPGYTEISAAQRAILTHQCPLSCRLPKLNSLMHSRIQKGMCC
jgi:hypothetical protein